MKRGLKYIVILGIIIFVLTILNYILSFSMVLLNDDYYSTVEGQEELLNPLGPLGLFSIFISILSIIFLYGFIILAKKFNNKLLFWTTVILILISIISLFGTNYTRGVSLNSELNENTTDNSFNFIAEFTSFLFYMQPGAWSLGLIGISLGGSLDASNLFFSLLLPQLVGFILYILFGIGIMKLKEVPFSMPVGIIEIIGFIISPLIFINHILMIIMFFKASKKFES